MTWKIKVRRVYHKALLLPQSLYAAIIIGDRPKNRPGEGRTVLRNAQVAGSQTNRPSIKEKEALEQRKTDTEVALELMRLVLDQAGSRRLSPTRTLALYHLCKEADAYAPEGTVTAAYLEDELKKLLQ